MELEISAAEANRKFSHLIRAVREDGCAYVVTSHGRPVARITPVERREDDTSAVAFKMLMKRLKLQAAKNIGGLRRDQIYNRGKLNKDDS